MPEQPKQPPTTFAKNIIVAPVVYFDQAPSYGVLAGIFAIELTAHMILPTRGERAIPDTLMTAHLRGSPEAMLALRGAIDGCLAMYEQAKQATAVAN